MGKKILSEEEIKRLQSGNFIENDAETLLKNSDLSNMKINNINLSFFDLSGSFLFKTDLTGCELYGANLSNADATGAILNNCNMMDADCSNIGLGHAEIKDAVLFNCNLTNATLTGCNLYNSDLRTAILVDARARECNFTNVDFTGAELTHIDLTKSNLEGCNFREVNLTSATLKDIQKYKNAQWIGVDITNVNFAGAYLVRREIMDQNYLDEFQNQSKFHRYIYNIWKITSDCGRSVRRWTLFTAIQILFFAIIYNFIGIDYGSYKTIFSPIYFSVVTMTTLGFGDVLPKTSFAQIVVVLQVLSGYVMLGGLLAILTNKMGRRAE